MVALGIPTEKLRYNARAGRWIGPGGGFLSKADVKAVIGQEHSRLESEMLASTGRLARNKISVEQWQAQLIKSQKNSNLRAMVAGAGGRAAFNDNVRNSVLLKHHQRRQQDFAIALSELTQKLTNGELTLGQVQGWAKYQASNAEQSFNESQFLTRMIMQGHNEFMRWVANTKHCPDCPGHSTNGQWIAIEDGVPVGSRCRCKGRCRCGSDTRFNPERALAELGGGNILDRIRSYDVLVRRSP